MKKGKVLILTLFLTLFFFTLHNIYSEGRIALIIGNSDYAIGKLKNAVNDSRLMRSTLSNLGFKVIYIENADKRKMKKKVQEFADQLRITGSIGLFFYAGHGVQIEGKNYLIPLGVNIENESDVEFECFPADRILASMEWAENKLNIVILDACRNNPFERSFRRSFSRGLAQMHGGKGVIIAYATAPGSTASDGPGANNGIYTASLVRVLKIPNLSIEKVFSKTREHVYKSSNEKQLPWTASSIIGDFIFKPEVSKQQDIPPKKIVNIKPKKKILTKKNEYGSIKISAHPYAEITIDGRKFGEVPPMKIIELSTGTHEVILKKGNKIKIIDINVKMGKTETIFYSFSKK